MPRGHFACVASSSFFSLSLMFSAYTLSNKGDSSLNDSRRDRIVECNPGRMDLFVKNATVFMDIPSGRTEARRHAPYDCCAEPIQSDHPKTCKLLNCISQAFAIYPVYRTFFTLLVHETLGSTIHGDEEQRDITVVSMAVASSPQSQRVLELHQYRHALRRAF